MILNIVISHRARTVAYRQTVNFSKQTDLVSHGLFAHLTQSLTKNHLSRSTLANEMRSQPLLHLCFVDKDYRWALSCPTGSKLFGLVQWVQNCWPVIHCSLNWYWTEKHVILSVCIWWFTACFSQHNLKGLQWCLSGFPLPDAFFFLPQNVSPDNGNIKTGVALLSPTLQKQIVCPRRRSEIQPLRDQPLKSIEINMKKNC